MEKLGGIKVKILILVLWMFLIFFPILGRAQQVDITVGATVSGTSGPPVIFCGDGICNGVETCASCPADCGSCGGGGGGIYIPPETTVIFKGRAYPLANLTILKNDTVISTFKAQETGLFEREIKGFPGGTFNFSIFAEDTDGRRSVTVGFTVSILEGRTTTISGIFISPTIELGPTQVEQGQSVNILGQAFPQSQINIFVSSNEIVKEALADTKGKWAYKLDTSPLELGEHKSRAKAIFGEGEQSPLSQILAFLIVKKGALVCKGADLNFDGKVNIIDFSILLYFWGQRNPSNGCADINFDGIVNIVDFSIMMYWWTG